MHWRSAPPRLARSGADSMGASTKGPRRANARPTWTGGRGEVGLARSERTSTRARGGHRGGMRGMFAGSHPRFRAARRNEGKGRRAYVDCRVARTPHASLSLGNPAAPTIWGKWSAACLLLGSRAQQWCGVVLGLMGATYARRTTRRAPGERRRSAKRSSIAGGEGGGAVDHSRARGPFAQWTIRARVPPQAAWSKGVTQSASIEILTVLCLTGEGASAS